MNENLSFEQALNELEEIVNSLERGDVTLDEAIKAFERGSDLKDQCEKRLKEAKMKVSAIITLKKDVLDPQGKVIHETLDGMGFNSVNEVRQGKYFEIDVKENDPKKAKDLVENMCKKLLANLVIENYQIIETQ